MIAAVSHPAARWLLEPSSRLVGLLVLVVVLVFGGFYFRLAWAVSRELYGGGGTNPAAMVNCADCGARTTTDPPECDYCGTPLAGEADGAAV